MKKNISIFFVSSSLQVLAAQCIAENFDNDRELILVLYKKNLDSIVKNNVWAKHFYMPWPRHDPDTGFFGVHRRLIKNLLLLDHIVDGCQSLYLYSAVYDTEAINYFVSFFQKKIGDSNFSARILPDGIISTQRNNLTFTKRILKKTRNLRYLFNRNLIYTHFTGDRIGSDAKFVDKIYVLNGMPHQYDAKKVTILPPLFKKSKNVAKTSLSNGLVIGQPLKGFKIMSQKNIYLTSTTISQWLNEKQVSRIYYKKHPKDTLNTLNNEKYLILPDELLIEEHLASNYFDYIIGVNSTVLLLAKQICSTNTNVISFGINKINFKNKSDELATIKLFKDFNIQMKKI